MPGPIIAHRPWSVLLLAALLLGALPVAWVDTAPSARAAGQDIDLVCTGVPAAGFRDAAAISPPFVEVVDCLAAYGITRGDAGDNYRPGAVVTRQQMALFLARFLTQADTGTTVLPAPAEPDDAFDDLVGLHPEEARTAVNLLAEAGITRGAGDGSRYLPGTSVTRGQLASFVTRTMVAAGGELPLVPTTSFPDVDPRDVHAASIEALGALGVIRGYPDGRFGPADLVTREQVAQFLMRAAQVLASQQVWAGDLDLPRPPSEPVPPDTPPETPPEVETPATPSVPTPPDTAATASMVLGIDGSERRVGAVLTVTVRLLDRAGAPMAEVPLGSAVLRAANWEDGALGGPDGTGRLDPSTAAAVVPAPGEDAPTTDASGRAEVVHTTEGFTPGRYLVVVWVADADPDRLVDAAAWDTIPVTLAAPELDAATLVATASLRTDVHEGVHLLLSDGEAVRAEPADEHAAYRVEGLPASRQRFLTDARPGDLVEVTLDAEGRGLALTRVEARTRGIIEVHDGVRFVDPASGVALSADLDDQLAGQQYEIDGEAVGERRFREHLSTGDHLEVEVVAEDDDGQPRERRYRLTDGVASGLVVTYARGVAAVDPNPEDAWTVGPGGLGDGLRVEVAPGASLPAEDPDAVDEDPRDDGDADEHAFLVDGESTDLDGFVAALQAVLAPRGGSATLTHRRERGVVRAELSTVPPPPFATVRGTIIGGDRSGIRTDPPGLWQLELAVQGVRETLVVVPDVDAEIDGVLTTSEELIEAVSFGDRVACEGVDRDGACTRLRLTRQSFVARVVFVDVEARELDLLLDGGYLLQELDPQQRPFGVRGEPVAYAVDGVAYDGEFDELLATLAAIDLEAHEVRVSLRDDGLEGRFHWEFTGVPEPTVATLR